GVGGGSGGSGGGSGIVVVATESPAIRCLLREKLIVGTTLEASSRRACVACCRTGKQQDRAQWVGEWTNSVFAFHSQYNRRISMGARRKYYQDVVTTTPNLLSEVQILKEFSPIIDTS
ncbi:unnamed protein product, partial [Sphacelaria rigidula]